MQTALPAAAATAFLLTVTSATALAEPITLDAKPQTVSMFKNGLAMVTTKAEIPEAGAYQLPAPQARYGSLWLNWSDGLTLKDIMATEVEHTDSSDALNLTDLLRANVGKSLSIRLNEDDAWITGKLIAMPTPPPPSPIPVDARSARGYGGYPQTIPNPQPNLMLFETGDGTLALAPHQVAQVRFEDGKANIQVKNVVKDTAIAFTAEASDDKDAGNTSGDVVMRYLAQGISWSPSYVVQMIDDDTAHLACKAVIVNDLMDLSDVDLELIAGYPNLKFASAPTPMGPTPLSGLLASLQQGGQQRSYGVLSNAMAQQADVYYRGADASYVANIPSNVAGESAEDLYYYQVPGVTLAKGERGYFPLIAADVPGKDVYTWDIPDFIDRNDRYAQQPDERKEVVWHSLELTNTTDQPWTTAAAMTVKDGRVLGQDMLNYTPPNGTSLLKITQAVSIHAEQNEVEVERQRNAAQFHGSTYDKVTVEGTLSITNYKNKPVTIKITKLLSGEVASADLSPEVVKIASGLSRVNPRSKLTWEVQVEPGNDKALQVRYRYSFFTR